MHVINSMLICYGTIMKQYILGVFVGNLTMTNPIQGKMTNDGMHQTRQRDITEYAVAAHHLDESILNDIFCECSVKNNFTGIIDQFFKLCRIIIGDVLYLFHDFSKKGLRH